MHWRPATCATTTSLLVLAVMSIAQTSQFDARAARRISDSFVDALVANRISDAYQKMNPAYSTHAAQVLDSVLDSCGRPVDSKSQNNGVVGEDQSAKGRMIPTITYLYLFTESNHKRCSFHVQIEAGNDRKYYVTSLGCGSERW